MTHPEKNLNNAGFTLLELLIVVVILGILAGLVAPRFFDQPEKARVAATQQQLKGVAEALELYNLDNRDYPTTEQGLKALVERPSLPPEPTNWKDGGYLPKMPKDAWGRDFIYLSPGVHGSFDLVSYGADGKPGGEAENADISNWE